jgi:hypothetical protein
MTREQKIEEAAKALLREISAGGYVNVWVGPQRDALSTALSSPATDEGTVGTCCQICGGDGTATCHAITKTPVAPWPFDKEVFIKRVIDATPWCEHPECEARGSCHVHKLDVEKAIDVVLSNQAQIASNKVEKTERVTPNPPPAPAPVGTPERKTMEEWFKDPTFRAQVEQMFQTSEDKQL